MLDQQVRVQEYALLSQPCWGIKGGADPFDGHRDASTESEGIYAGAVAYICTDFISGLHELAYCLVYAGLSFQTV
jgi:hypothetical protein